MSSRLALGIAFYQGQARRLYLIMNISTGEVFYNLYELDCGDVFRYNGEIFMKGTINYFPGEEHSSSGSFTINGEYDPIVSLNDGSITLLHKNATIIPFPNALLDLDGNG